MYQKNRPSGAPNFQTNQQAKLKVLQKYVKNLYPGTPNFRNSAFPKANSKLAHNSISSHHHERSVNNVSKNPLRAQSPQRLESTKVLYRRQDALEEASGSIPATAPSADVTPTIQVFSPKAPLTKKSDRSADNVPKSGVLEQVPKKKHAHPVPDDDKPTNSQKVRDAVEEPKSKPKIEKRSSSAKIEKVAPEPRTKQSSNANKNPKPNFTVSKVPKAKKVAPNEPPRDDLDFHQVTQELARVIRTFQQQILSVSVTKTPMEEVPSAMIQPKDKKFFKTVSDKSCTDQKQKSSVVSCDNTNSNNLPKRSSLKSLSRGTMGDVRRHRSFTHNDLVGKGSTTSRTSGRSLNADPLRALKEEVQKVIRDRKTFTVVGSSYEPVRRALLARGWIERFHPSYRTQLDKDLRKFEPNTVGHPRRADLTKNLIRSKLLEGHQVDLYWSAGPQAFKDNSDRTLISRLKKDIFSYTNKEGLCEASKTSYWFQKGDVSKLNHPRTYSLGKAGDVDGFIGDFRRTAAMSLLKWVVKIHETKECKLMSPTGKVPLETFDFALNECCKMIKEGRHDDIDAAIPEAAEREWDQFLDYFYKLVHYNNHFKDEGNESEDSLVRRSNYALNNLKSHYQHVDMDGLMNMWILKPISGNRGRGIHLCRTLKYALKVVREHTRTRYVIQKYIERPLLIYNTKFDIRQWFLISECSPLTIWMYRECYMRFSSQTYNLRKLHESVHLTNNAVQHKYKNRSLDAALPSYNMWDSHEFQKYLSDIGYPDVFKDVVYPGMRQGIVAAILIHQDRMVVRRNCFELYGADFMLTEDFRPWLIEINGGPAMQGSTPVTARMCPRVLEDVIKVVIDRARDRKASTGSFEMIYKQQPTELPKAAASLQVKGAPLKKGYFHNSQQEVERRQSQAMKSIDGTQVALKNFGDEIKKTLASLLEIIQKKRGLLSGNENLDDIVV